MMQTVKPKLVRITTVPVSLRLLLRGQMRFMKQQGFEVVMISSPGADAEAVEQQEACEMITLPMERTIHPLADLRALLRLIALLRNLRPDMVHTHTPKAGLLGMLAAWYVGVPVRLHTIAGLPWMEARGPLRWLLKQMERLTAVLAHRVYPNSKGLYEFLQRQGVATRPGKMRLLGNGSSNGIDTSFFSEAAIDPALVAALRQEAGIAAAGRIWIFAGRLVREKGMHELVTAFQQVHNRYPNDQLWLLGEEEPRRDALAETDRRFLHQHPAVKMWGFRTDVRPFFAAADVLVFPSYREGLPNVPLQAGAMGCALIVTDINGCNEIVEQGVNGLLVPPKDAHALLQAMLQLRQQPELMTTFARKSREKITARYDQQKVWNLLLEEYRELLNGVNE